AALLMSRGRQSRPRINTLICCSFGAWVISFPPQVAGGTVRCAYRAWAFGHIFADFSAKDEAFDMPAVTKRHPVHRAPAVRLFQFDDIWTEFDSRPVFHNDARLRLALNKEAP